MHKDHFDPNSRPDTDSKPKSSGAGLQRVGPAFSLSKAGDSMMPAQSAAGAIGEVSACEAAVRAVALATPVQLERIRSVDLPLLWQVAGPEGLGRVAEFEACLEAAVNP